MMLPVLLLLQRGSVGGSSPAPPKPNETIGLRRGIGVTTNPNQCIWLVTPMPQNLCFRTDRVVQNCFRLPFRGSSRISPRCGTNSCTCLPVGVAAGRTWAKGRCRGPVERPHGQPRPPRYGRFWKLSARLYPRVGGPQCRTPPLGVLACFQTTPSLGPESRTGTGLRNGPVSVPFSCPQKRCVWERARTPQRWISAPRTPDPRITSGWGFPTWSSSWRLGSPMGGPGGDPAPTPTRLPSYSVSAHAPDRLIRQERDCRQEPHSIRDVAQ
jgi:hypothetical protein